jgi:hypothetical protein
MLGFLCNLGLCTNGGELLYMDRAEHEPLPQGIPTQSQAGARAMRYPVWLEALAGFSFIVIIIGLIAAIVSPDEATGVIFPAGLAGVWLSSRVAQKF